MSTLAGAVDYTTKIPNNVNLADDQHVLVDASARFAEAAHPLTALRDGSWDEPSVAARYLRQAGELGWFSLVVAEEFGGGTVSGNGVVDAALVAMARGRLLQPGPFVGTNVVARALSTGGTAEHRRDVLPTLMPVMPAVGFFWFQDEA